MSIDTYWHLINQIDAAVLILDSNGDVQFANQDLINLFGLNSEEQIRGKKLRDFLSKEGKECLTRFYQTKSFDESFSFVDTISLDDGTCQMISLTAKKTPDTSGLSQGSIWTIKETFDGEFSGPILDQQKKMEDLQWLADQGRELLSISHWPDILDIAGQALQEKLGDCIVVTLTKPDEDHLKLEGYYGIKGRLLSKVLDLLGIDTDKLLPIDKRFLDTYSKRQLFHHTTSFEDFASSFIPPMISRQIESMLGIKNVYTIGLEGNQRVMGCFYIYSKGPDFMQQVDLVESFTFQVALALEKTMYAEDLKLSEQQFQTIFEFAPDGYYLSDLQGNFLGGNLSAEKIIGYDRSEMIGQNFLSVGLITKDQIPKAGKLLAQNLLGKSTGPDEFILTRKDGSLIHVEISTHPVKINERSVVLGIARDISDRRESEETLARSHDSLTRVLEGIDAHVYVADLESYEILYMNKKMIEDFGGNFTGKPCYQIFRNQKNPCSFCTNAALINDQGKPGEVVIWESQSAFDDRWYRNYDRAIYWTDQQLVRMQIAVDITESAAAAIALKESEKRYRYLFESAHDAVMTLGPPDWYFTSGNPALVKMFALESEEEFLSYKPWDLSPVFQPDGQKSEEKAQEMINIAVEQGTNYFRWIHKRVNGEEFPAIVQLTRTDFGDEFFLQATVSDISDRILSEERLLQQMEDLALMNRLSNASNQGVEINEIIDLFSTETKKIFQANNSSVFLLSKDGERLLVDPGMMDSVLRNLLGKFIKMKPGFQVALSIDDLGLFKELFESGEVRILDRIEEIREVMLSIVRAAQGPELVRAGMRRMVPQIIRRVNVQSAMVVPLSVGKNRFGMVLIPSKYIFSNDDLERSIAFSDQLAGILDRVRADREREEKIRELELIYQTFIEGSQIERVNDVCQHIADKIREVNPEAYVVVTLFDSKEQAIMVRGLSGFAGDLESLTKILGKDPVDFKLDTTETKIDPEFYSQLTSGKLEFVPAGLYEVSRRTIPKSVCKTAERLAGVDKTYIVGFGSGMVSNGGITLFLKKGETVQFPEAIETIASHFAVIFERRKIQEEIIQRQTHLEALRDVEQDIVSQLNLEELLFSIAEKAVSIVDAVASGFSVYSEENEELEFIAYTGYDAMPDKTNVEIGEGLAGKVWQTKETIIVENYLEWEGRSENWVPYGNYFLAGIPVCWGDEILGVLEIALDIGNELAAADIEILELFATQAAIAIKNARLFTDEQLRRQEAETLREGGMLINQMMGRPELLDMILTALGKVVPYSSAFIQLVRGSDIVVEGFNNPTDEDDLFGFSVPIERSNLYHQVLFDGRNIVLGTMDQINEFSLEPVSQQAESWLAVPLEIKGNRIGLISLNHTEPDQYSSRDAELVHDFANQAVIAIENNRLFEELRRKTSEMEVVYESALVLTQELQPDIFYNHLYDQVEKLFNPDAYLLAIYDPNSAMIDVEYATESGIRQPQSMEKRLTLHEKNSLISWIVRNKTPLLIGNVETDSLPVRAQQKGKTIRSFLGVPLLVGDRMIGALVVQSYKPQAYSQEHRRLLQLMGNQVAIGLENSRLFEDAQKRLARLSSLREVDQAISGSLDLEQTMDVLINQLTSSLNVDAACVLAYNKDQDLLEYVSSRGFWTSALQKTSLPLGKGLAGEAAVSRSLVHIPDLNAEPTSIHNSPHFNQEKFVSYFAHPLIVKGELVGVLEALHRSKLDPNPEWINFLDALARLAAIAIDRLNLYNNLTKSNIELKQAYDATIEGWARAIELRDDETEGHSRRVAAIVLNLARKMGLKGSVLTHMRRGALLHDIGKMAIPDGILLNTGKLSPEEWKIMKKHPVYAREMLSPIDYLIPALDIPFYHHERWDGSGYPQGLSGNDIPIAARIFAVVDVWDALQSDRPYRKAWTEKQAVQYLKDQSGKEFDPEIVNEFLDLMGKK